MNTERTTTVDFVAKSPSANEWKLVLVEAGPWAEPVADHLRRIQGRLYGCLDAAIDGQLAEEFPETKGRRIVIRLDCYDVPRSEVGTFFRAFSQGVLAQVDYREALENSPFVESFGFEINFDDLH